MNLPPKQPEDKAESQEMPLAKRPEGQTHLLSNAQLSECAKHPVWVNTSPFLFAAMETCWIDAIFICLARHRSLRAAHTAHAAMAPFVLIIGSQGYLISWNGVLPVPQR